MRILDLLAVVLFLAGMAGMGVWFARKNTSTEAYFLGLTCWTTGRRSRIWRCLLWR